MLVEWDIYGYLIGISYRDIMRYKGTYMCQRCKFPELHGAFDVSSKPCLKKKQIRQNEIQQNEIQLAQKQLATLASGCSDTGNDDDLLVSRLQ